MVRSADALKPSRVPTFPQHGGRTDRHCFLYSAQLMLRTLFIDFNSYFAAVEQQINPQLRGRPIAVLPVMTESTSCIAASPEAKRFGVKTGTSVRDARQLCPEIVFVEAQHAVYVEFHQRAIAAVDRIAPVHRVLSIDEMACELTGVWRQRDKAIALAHAVKKEITTSLGECLGSSIGIAPNILLGKLASDMQKPNGLTVIELADIPHAFAHLAPKSFTGIGPGMVVRLAACGIHSMVDLYAAPRDLLRTAWGSLAGSDMYDKLRGQWHDIAPTTSRSLGHAHVLPPALRNPQGAFDVLNRLVQKAGMRLRKQGFYATAMTLSVRANRHRPDSQGGHRDTRFAQTQDTIALLQVLNLLWHSGLHTLQQPKAVSVTLHGLIPSSQHTPDLWDVPQRDKVDAAAVDNLHPDMSAVPEGTPTSPNTPLQAPLRNRDKLHEAVDRINRRHGKSALYFATAHNALDHAPMRIAFNRIPDVETER